MGWGGAGKASAPKDWRGHRDSSDSESGSEDEASSGGSADDHEFFGDAAEAAHKRGEVEGASDEEAESALSPFGPERFPSASACWAHAEEHHGFSLVRLRGAFGAGVWTDYHRIRLVNYLRSLGPEAARQEASSLSPSAVFWSDDRWLQPVLEDDRLLFDDEDDDSDMNEAPPASSAVGAPSAAGVGAPTSTVAAETLAEDNARLRSELAAARKLVSTLLGEEDAGPPKTSPSSSGSGGPGAGAKTEERTATAAEPRAWHYLDVRAVEAVRKELLAHPELVDGKDVLDVGCTTATLATLAARLGARGVDVSSVASSVGPGCAAVQRNVAQVGGQQDVLSFSRPAGGDAGGRDCDFLTSEQLLSELRYGPSLMRFLVARQQRLRPGGKVLPRRISLHICAVDFSEDIIEYEKWVKAAPLGGLFTAEDPLPEGLRPPCAAPPCAEPAVELEVGRVASQGSAKLLSLDLESSEPQEPLPNRRSFHLKLRPGRCVTGLAIYLEADLGGQPTERLSAAPPGCVPDDLERPDQPAWAPRRLARQTVLHLAAEGVNPVKALRLSGQDFPAVEGFFSATSSADGSRVEVKVELRGTRDASGAGRGKGPDAGAATATFVLAA